MFKAKVEKSHPPLLSQPKFLLLGTPRSGKSLLILSRPDCQDQEQEREEHGRWNRIAIVV
jgi:hypothetical protein